jgi:hypothetical protein
MDNTGDLGMTLEMPSLRARRVIAAERSLAALKSQLAGLEKRGQVLWGELGAQEQEYVERKMTGAPSAVAFRQYESLRDRDWALETRRVQVRGLIAEKMAPGEDLR